MPHPDSGFRLKRRLLNSGFPEDLLKSILVDSHPGNAEDYLLLNSYPLYVWVPACGAQSSLLCSLQHHSQVQLHCWFWVDGQPPEVSCQKTEIGRDFVIELPPKPGLLGHLLMVQATTIDSHISCQRFSAKQV